MYKQRWQIEIFFVRHQAISYQNIYRGTSENAVKIQIWTALITIHPKYRKNSTANILAIIKSSSIYPTEYFCEINLQYWLDKPFDQPPESQKTYYQGFFLKIYRKIPLKPIYMCIKYICFLFRTVLKFDNFIKLN
ncbi:MAG: hypothetical protein U0T78_08415 [Cloacibacterium normanense]